MVGVLCKTVEEVKKVSKNSFEINNFDFQRKNQFKFSKNYWNKDILDLLKIGVIVSKDDDGEFGILDALTTSFKKEDPFTIIVEVDGDVLIDRRK